MESFIVQAEDQLSSLDFEVDNAGGRRPRGSNLTFGERRALEELAADNTIVINKADKANVIVVRNHTDYAAEGFVHLSDAAVYRELPYDTTLEVEHLVTGFVQKLFKQGLINEEMAKFCLPNKNLRMARIYFLKKTHKTPMGIRPIVSGINCPTENLSQFVDVWLQPLMRAALLRQRLYAFYQRPGDHDIPKRLSAHLHRRHLPVHKHTTRGRNKLLSLCTPEVLRPGPGPAATPSDRRDD